ncbi:UDP-N-acetylmuramoyl-tripeptide--D-alanyl-D-alanine ligase [Paucilactobacillus kaifaensis]|uniref:UDP-N-acetylmuramoyl-tripeptide--D-alanyl-D- alanine ligase n=1 Tax=Paucilactobacillus kaifaensis TaxID=2559921 RepID=UPI0010F48CFF|nr:UDP-N-acetylmuramoyl-tripeptide--D-alanyl-D-alanine ligase [Paucilactobacillus kaifaensis]
MKMKLAEVAKAISVENDISRWQDVEISSVAFDSRQIANGALFVPLNGKQDGHKFVSSAFNHGASATLWASDHPFEEGEQPFLVVKDPLRALQELGKYYLSKINPIVVAVTGSNGKTTTKDMIASILSTQMNVTKTYENFNNQIGVPVTLLNMESNTEAVVVEMGMDHPGELDFLTKMVNPDIAVITMIGEAHIEFFGTRDKIADAKMEITHGLKEDGTFVFNGDEPLLTQRASQVDRVQRTFGRQLENDLYATSVNLTSHEIKFTTNMWPETEFTVPMMGEYNVNNALAALSVADLLRIDPMNMQTGLAHVELTQNRAQWVVGQKGEQILSDVYNSNPTAAKQVLHAFSLTHAQGKRVVVLGDMLELGDAAANLHASLAQELDPSKVQSVYLIGSHMKVLRDKLQDKYPDNQLHYYVVEQKEGMTKQLENDLTADDIVLLKASHGLHLETVLASLQRK